MTDIFFASPQWIHLLWVIVVFVALLVLLEFRGGAVLSRFVGAALQQRLVRSSSRPRRILRILLLGLTGVFLTVALMRPQWGISFVSTPRVGAEIMVCLDVSRSMLAEDVAPNRLQRAKVELRDLLTYLKGDQVGLIAFAGRASVLSPLTPDFGFLRLVLDEAGPHSVNRGGTRLEEPIRKAVAGFGEVGEASRSILLITDGEDHDSFPLEAAKAAAERGIRVLAIGFGDEAGSQISITDPQSGALKALLDGDGQPVISRLDGALLREIALLTEGAYIPAGTGVLDLESIYRRHIASLTRGSLDGQARVVRNDAFQWSIVFALLALLGAVASGAAKRSPMAGIGGVLLVVGWLGGSPPEAVAQSDAADADSQPAATADSAAGDAADPVSLPPRETYNLAVAKMAEGQLDRADELFAAARSDAGADGEARFSATYNLGWVSVKRADAALEQEPEAALKALQAAADWFREAIALRPGHADSRHNLELVLRRATVLADSLAEREEGELMARLEALIEQQRGYLDGLRSGVDVLAGRQDPHAASQSRSAFRELSVGQLALLDQAQGVSESADAELNDITSMDQEQRSAEDRVRAAQLQQTLDYLHRARERMGQARGQLRRLQAERAYRRAAGALAELKAARDQLLDPIARLDAMLADGLELLRLTSAKTALDQAIQLSDPQRSPAWLSNDYLSDTQQSLSARAQQLHAGLAAGLQQTEASAAEENGQQQPPRPQQPPQQQAFLNQLREAEPLIGAAAEQFEQALAALQEQRLTDAVEPQTSALDHLRDARERFLDLRRLIEVLHQDQRQIDDLLRQDDERSEQEITEYLPVASELQTKNRQRGARVGSMIADQVAQALTAVEQAENAEKAGQSPSGAGNPQQNQQPDQGNPELDAARAQLQQLTAADELQLKAQQSLSAATGELEKSTTGDGAGRDLAAVRDAVANARNDIEALRQLFFSVLDHLKETARKQLELGDETETIAALAADDNPDETAQRVGPLQPRQQQLATTAGAIGDALTEQASQAGQQAQQVQQVQQAQPIQPGQPTQPAQGSTGPAAADPAGEAMPAGPTPEQLLQAAEHVTAAKDKMGQAARGMQQDNPPFDLLRQHQDQAIESLGEAIALLQPEQPQQQQDEQDQQSQQQEQQQEQQDGQQSEDEQPQPEMTADPTQLLQGVRDREAERRSRQSQSQRQGYEPVAKDW